MIGTARLTRLSRHAYRKLVYRKHFLHRYEVVAAASVAPKKPLELRLDLVADSSKFSELLHTNPFLTDDDIACFTRQRSTCITVSNAEGQIVASSWMTSGEVMVHELSRVVAIPDGEHLSCRSYVSDEYRGLALLSHMIHRYTQQLDSSDVVWGLVYPWNTPSADSLQRIGWHLTGEYWTSWVCGIKRSSQRTVNGPNSESRDPVTPTCVILAEQAWGGTLHACRSLMRRGVPTHVAVAGAGARIYQSSRFCLSARGVDDSNADAFCSELRKWIDHEIGADERVVLIPASDRLVDFLNQERDSFGSRYQLGIPERDVVERLLTKPSSFELAQKAGLSVPPWRRVVRAADIPACRDLQLPVVIRPSGWSMQGNEPFKVIVARSREECASILLRMVDGGADLVVQEYVGGADTSVEFGLCWRARQHNQSLICTGVKHREASDDGGVMVWGSAIELAATREATERFVEIASFVGLGGAEFIRSNGTLWFIEFNPRLEAITFLATQAGLDLVAAEFDDLAERTVNVALSRQRPASAWIGSAWFARLISPSGSCAEAIADRARFARSPNRVKAVWSVADPGPALQIIRMIAAGAMRRVPDQLQRILTRSAA